MMALVLVIGLLGTGIVALFWDLEVSRDNNFEGGVLDLKVDADWSMTQTGCDGLPHTTNGSAPYTDDPNVWAFNVSCMAPCDRGEVTFSLTNEGCIGGLITMNVTPYTEGEGDNPEPETAAPPTGVGDTDPDAELDEQLWIRFWHDLDGDNIYAGEPLLAEGKVEDVLSMVSKTSYVAEFSDYMLDCGATTWIGFEWLVQDHRELSNEIMGDWLNFDIEFYLTQRPCGEADFDIYDKRHDPTMTKLSTNMICFDICNNGTAAGTVTVDLDIDTSPPYSDSMGVLLGAGECKYLCFNWTPTQVGNYTISLSIPGDSEGPNPVEVIGAPATFMVVDKAHTASSPNASIPIWIYANITNTGDYTGTKNVNLGITGPVPYAASTPLTLNPAQTSMVSWMWIPGWGGTYYVTVSTPDDSMGPQLVNVGVTIPPTTWVYNSTFSGTGGPYSDASVWTYTPTGWTGLPVDQVVCPLPVPNPHMAAEVHVDHGNAGAGPAGVPQRKPSNAPQPITYNYTRAYPSINPIDGYVGELVYRWLNGWIFGTWLINEWAYLNYATNSTHIGKPYYVGQAWTYEIFSQAAPGGGPLSPWHWWYEDVVVATGMSMASNDVDPGPAIVPGTLTDVTQIDTYCDWNMNCVFEVNELTNSRWYSDTIKQNVKAEDYLTFIDHSQGAATCVGQGVCTYGSCTAPLGAPSDMTETNDLWSAWIVLV
jgi:hypothetical protein